MDGVDCVGLDFIPQVLHDPDEAECIREDQERNRQVKECLDTMFADMEMHDFEDEEDGEEEGDEAQAEEEEEHEEDGDAEDDGGYLEDIDHGEIDGGERAVESFDDVNQSQNNFDDEQQQHGMGDGPHNWPPSSHPWLTMGEGTQQTSTPRGDYPPPALSTPSTVPRGYYSTHQVATYHQSVDTSDVEPDYAAPTDRGDDSQYWVQGEDDQQFGYDDDEQGDMVDPNINYHDPSHQNMAAYHPNQFLAGYPQNFPMAYVANGIYPTHHPGIYHDGTAAFNLIHESASSAATLVGNFHPAPYPSVTPTLPVNRDDFRSEVEATFTEGDLESGANNESESQSPTTWTAATTGKSGLRSPVKLSTLQATGRDGGGMDGYRVRFANQTSGGSDGEVGRRGRGGTDGMESSEGTVELSSSANAQENFLRQDGGSRDVHQMAQLQILYNARGKRIDELTKELESVKDELSREIRLLKHELSLARGQWDGARDSLDECRHLLTEAMTSKSRAEGQAAALQLQITSLKSDNEELTKKIISAESTIESLNDQLSESRSTDNWTRAKQHYETTVATLKHKNEAESLRMKQQLDDMNHRVEMKNEEVTSLRKQLADVTKESELSQISRAEAINRLARSLHDSQDQCNQLLESGAGQELSRLKLQLQDAIAGKSFADDLNAALQSDLQELKDQVTMYESLSQFGLLPGGHGGMTSISSSRPGCFSPPSIDPDDSYAQLGIKNPHPMRIDSELSSTSEMLSGLKNELERCVRLYRDKRLQVAALQADLKSAKSSLAEVMGKLESATKSRQESEAKLQETSECRPGQGLAEKRLERELEKICKEKEELVKEVQELQIRMEEACASEQQATEQCRDLSRQMSELVKEHDEDKRQMEANQKLALERCQAAMLEHYERAKKQTRQEMREESEEKMVKLRQELGSLEQELDETKRLYVDACEKRDEVEEEVNRKWQTILSEQLDELRQQMTSDKEDELQRLRSTMTTDAVAMTTENDKWLEEQRKRIEMEMNAKLLKSEEDWKRSKKLEMEEAIWRAEQELKHQMECAFDVRMKEELDKAVEKCQSDLRSKLQLEMEDGIVRAKDEWRSTEMAAWKAEHLEAELEKAKETWRSDELEKELSCAKDEWMRTVMSNETALHEKIVAEAKVKWERDELSVAVEKAKQEVRGQIELRSAQVRAALEMDWRERSEAAAREHNHQMEALESQHKEELTKAVDATEKDWHQKMESALQEMAQQAKVAKQELLQLADEHNKSEIAKHESTFQKRLTARVAEYEQQLSAVLHDNDNLREQLHLLKTLVEQQEQQLTIDFEEAKTRWSNELEEVRGELEKKLEMSETKRSELEKVMENLVERMEEEKREELRKKEESYENVVGNYRRQVEVLGDKLGRAERVFKAMEAKTQRRLSSLQDSLEREHASALAQLEARLVEQSREHDVAMEEMRGSHATEVETLKEELEQESRKTGDVVGLQAAQVKALEEMRNYYLHAIAKVKDEVFNHLEQTSRQNADVLRQRLMRERRRTARHLRKYYLRCFDQLLQRDFDRHLKRILQQHSLISSFRAYALQSMQNLLDNMSDRDTSPSSLPSSASELTTPRDNNIVAPPVAINPASLQTTPASFSNQPTLPSDPTTSEANVAAVDVGHFDGSPWSNASSVTSSFRKLPPGGVTAEKRTRQRRDESRMESVTPTPENQEVGDFGRQTNLYFESPSRKSRERVESTQFENEVLERLSSNQKSSHFNREALNGDSKTLQENKGRPSGVHDRDSKVRSPNGEFSLNGHTENILQQDSETPKSSLATERTALPSAATGSRQASEKSRVAQEMSQSASSLKPRSDATFVMTRATNVGSFQRQATAATTTVATGTNSRVSTLNAAVVIDDNSNSSTHVGAATKSKKTNGGNDDDYVYTSLSQRLMSATSSPKSGQFSTLKSWSVSDLTRSTEYSVPKTTAVPSYQMASAVSHDGLTAAAISRPLATSSLSNISSLSNSNNVKTVVKSPFSYSNFSLSATSHKPAATFSPSHVPFTTPPISHTSASSLVPPAAFIQDHTMARTAFNSSASRVELRREEDNAGLSNAGLHKPVIRNVVQALGRETRK